ncbi:Uu.00g042070.m01.CDS01 [Anthostomella pinea]|uniref:Carboxylic ester hydrolase n=1 Tax=Anthostomella pinea TaxID=933095 RepID=A0AAI8VAD7_9PEZI|nr:Uu.00g042070.m01.CDS01 [Anthostomella pinea]
MRATFISYLSVLLGLTLAQSPAAPVVDVDYALYQGYYDEYYDPNTFKGIRYAAAPVGELQWQLPQDPPVNRSEIIPAVEDGYQCPQSTNQVLPAVTGVSNEDCLSLSVLAPVNATGLPVLVWIHGGGYGIGSAPQYPLPELVRTNGNAFIVVSIQYRLGAFGFLSSTEVARSGVLNAGIHDMIFALKWVQSYIDRFGGDKNSVTISGISAGAGASMLLAMRDGGHPSESLFEGKIASSPFLPTQWRYDGSAPTEAYNRFAEAAGCSTADVATNGTVFDCLVATDSSVLQNASDYVSRTGIVGQWAFNPVTDGTLIREAPTQQLPNGGDIAGTRLLTSNDMNEGPLFVQLHGITSRSDFIAWLQDIYPLLSEQNVTKVLDFYDVPDDVSGTLQRSNGRTPPFSTTTSQFAAGWQQAAFNLYAETTIVCPSYWMAEAWAAKRDSKAWKYQFSVSPGLHGTDSDPLLSPHDITGTGMNDVFRTAVQRVWGNFGMNGDPTLGVDEVADNDQGNTTAAGTGAWPTWKGSARGNSMLNLNMTGGVPVLNAAPCPGVDLAPISYVPGNGSAPPLKALFEIVDASTWEDRREDRCRLWAEMGSWINE